MFRAVIGSVLVAVLFAQGAAPAGAQGVVLYDADGLYDLPFATSAGFNGLKVNGALLDLTEAPQACDVDVDGVSTVAAAAMIGTMSCTAAASPVVAAYVRVGAVALITSVPPGPSPPYDVILTLVCVEVFDGDPLGRSVTLDCVGAGV